MYSAEEEGTSEVQLCLLKTYCEQDKLLDTLISFTSYLDPAMLVLHSPSTCLDINSLRAFPKLMQTQSDFKAHHLSVSILW